MFCVVDEIFVGILKIHCLLGFTAIWHTLHIFRILLAISAAGLQFFWLLFVEYYIGEGILTKIFGEFLNFAPMNLHVRVIIHGYIYIYMKFIRVCLYVCLGTRILSVQMAAAAFNNKIHTLYTQPLT